MADRITRSMIEGSLKSFCKLADLPYSECAPAPGALWVSGANGGWRVERYTADGRGSSSVWHAAFRPARDVYREIHVAQDTLYILPADFLRARLEEVEAEQARRLKHATNGGT